jgi:hypothetical protein
MPFGYRSDAHRALFQNGCRANTASRHERDSDATVKTFTTDGEGRFQVALPPGHYVILREDAGARIGRWHFEADVVAGEMTKVNWTADSGMR